MKDENKKELAKDPITLKLLVDLLINFKKETNNEELLYLKLFDLYEFYLEHFIEN